ncbi:MAG: transcription accessory protein [Gammaproteobacteria bacterium (ex Lamellibrachia satsuma)]|nr:MAG: RNA-binding transcriptional accessory protein [Gammaproteobacteria bacterium (ex Lamellibrachia satsuma)]RRS31037.1 MAG: transcription accessory protein [Gammaproteobacteria bacterium (ex Lamellibrachia satsuma)]RRS34723.1 MAG: transcription accessory protein [Gammaproteobacteria bacterium (ex Lamellibrachia satsuma)]
MKRISQSIAETLSVRQTQVDATIQLLDEGATVPFIARYRKEATGGLDDAQLRTLFERLGYLRELEARRETILSSIEEQEKLTPELKRDILEADTKTRLEDLYLPYKPKRRTKAQIAREAGLEPLALSLLEDPSLSPEQAAAEFIDTDKGIEGSKAALDGARQILMERFAEDASLIGQLRDYVRDNGQLSSVIVTGKEQEGAKFSDYFEYSEAISKIPSHRALALFRGRNEGVLSLTLAVAENPGGGHPCEGLISKTNSISQQSRAADDWLLETVRWAWRVKISFHLELELLSELRERAEEEAIRVFASNLHDLLLAAPAGPRITIGLDPGLRTGVKVAVVNSTGKVLETDTIYPHVPQRKWEHSIARLAALAQRHGAELVAIGNGTASRETDKLAAELMQRHPELKLQKLMVSEAGASVYSASALASQELSGMDVSLRGAVSIARRLQDPLAELVKIDPKSIGVGQYQHDVNQGRLVRSLEAVVEDCVNAVGVDVNTASAPLLAQVSGLSNTLAQNIVSFRDEHGAFDSRKILKQVPRLGPKTYEQAAGFMRVMNGSNPLDRSSVHPESYPIVKKIIKETGCSIENLLGNRDELKALQPANFITEKFGLPTVVDIISELEKPGRDPRPDFKTASFKEGVESLQDLKPEMILEGVITNVTNFGAFVDIGVHQDGLVHISNLSNKFVKDPREVVKTGDLVKVKVLEVDIPRRRIGLTLRLDDKAERKPAAKQRQEMAHKPHKKPAQAPMGNSLAAAFAKARKD